MGKEMMLGITVAKSENISEWYTQVIQKAELADYSVVSGCIVFRPYSFRIWELLQNEIDAQIKKRGVQNAAFPLFIPENLLTKESTHVEGFAPEVAWVTHGGNTKLGERLAVRPTSETIMYDSYSKWIRSHRDLPLKINQWNNVVRWEFKHPVPFLRTREFLWNEGHTCYATKEEAESNALDILHMYKSFLENFMALPTFVGTKSKTETFAGAEYTMSCECFLPNGKAIQGPDSHHDGQIFSKAFDITFKDKNGETQYVWQNTWAISTRMIGVMILMHGDDQGLVLPPKLAPIQVVIVPILFDATKEAVLKKVHELKDELCDFRIHVDDREEITPGRKFNEWELKGVPLRIELGPKDLEKEQAIIVRRDTGEKTPTRLQDIKKTIEKQLQLIQNELYDKANKNLQENTIQASTWQEAMEGIKNKKLVKIHWCHTAECEEYIKDKTGGAKTLNIPFDSKPEGNCVQCGKPSECEIFIGKSY